MTSSSPAATDLSPLSRLAKLSAPCLSPRGIKQNWRRLGPNGDTLNDHNDEEPSDDDRPGLDRSSRGSFKSQATHASIIDDVASRTRLATQHSSLNYRTDTWSNTVSSLRVGATTIVLKPWTFLTFAAAILGILHLTGHLDEHVLAIPSVILVTLGGTMSLLLAFRLNSSYSRWWEGRVSLPARPTPIQQLAPARLAKS